MEAFTPNGSVNATSNGLYTHKTIFKTVFVILSVLIVLSNATVLLLYHITPRIRSTKNLLLASLALSDLSAGTVIAPITQSCFRAVNWNICIASAILFRFLAFSTMLHILAIIFEMYISILHPFWFVEKKHVRTVSVCIWATSFIVSVVPLAWLQDAFIVDPVSVRKEFIYFLVTFVVFFVIPFLVIVFAQVRMLRAISRPFTLVQESVPTPPLQTPMKSDFLTSLQRPVTTESRRDSTNEPGAPRRAFSSRQNRKVLVAFASMLGTFTICWLTWYLGIMFYYVDENNKFPTLSQDVKQTFHVLLFVPSLVNPLLYTYYKQDFRQALQALLKTSLKTLCH